MDNILDLHGYAVIYIVNLKIFLHNFLQKHQAESKSGP